MNNVLFALLLTLAAGMATGAGSVLSLFTKKTNTRFLASSLGFSAGVMIYVSMIEIFQKSRTYISSYTNDIKGYWLAVAAFFVGIIFIGIIDFLVPSAEGDIGNLQDSKKNEKLLNRMGFMTALAIGIHNFPEGMATFTSALKEPHLGIAIAAAISIHNIPEGIATAVPIYFATGSRRRAFGISFLSGIAEPVGAVLGYLVLRPFFNDMVFGLLFGFIAGIMVFISVEELLPMAREYEKSRVTIIGFIIGMAVIALSLLLFL
ncbi:MAG: zinc transporter ZupT [Clostridia bacterium]|nr:zinc transporter ZupT [Clostridia bacterium]